MTPDRGVLVAVACALMAACAASDPAPALDAGGGAIAFVGGRVVPAPDSVPISDGVVVIRAGTIAAVGARRDVAVPPGATVIDCAGATVTAGFWNSHVHFTQPVWADAAEAPAERLAAGLRAMLTSYGVVRVLDTGSQARNTEALRRRVAKGEVPGPLIMRAGGSFAPEGGSPYYVLPARLPELKDVASVPSLVDAAVDGGADGVKIFTGSWATETSIVDILAHTFPAGRDRRPWDRTLPAKMRERGMALIPTLKLFPYELRKTRLPDAVVQRVITNAEEQVRAFADLGGSLLFGTDVGYMTDYDTREEFELLRAAGLTFPQILAMLTTAPAERFGLAGHAGRLAPGLDADVVVIDGNPERDVTALAKVRRTMRSGRVIYERTP